MTTQVKKKLKADVERVFSLLDLSIRRSVIDLAPKYLSSLYVCTGFSTCHECQWIC